MLHDTFIGLAVNPHEGNGLTEDAARKFEAGEGHVWTKPGRSSLCHVLLRDVVKGIGSRFLGKPCKIWVPQTDKACKLIGVGSHVVELDQVTQTRSAWLSPCAVFSRTGGALGNIGGMMGQITRVSASGCIRVCLRRSYAIF